MSVEVKLIAGLLDGSVTMEEACGWKLGTGSTHSATSSGPHLSRQPLGWPEHVRLTAAPAPNDT